MAGGAFVSDGGGGGSYEGGVTGFVIITCIVPAMGGLLFGYDLGISGGVTSMEEFLSKFFPEVDRKMHNARRETAYCKFDNQLLQLFTSSLYLAALVSSFAASVYGRKISMFIGGLAFLIGALFNAFAVNVAMLIIGRLLLGVGVGFANQSTPVYLSEMTPAKLRGALNIGFQMAITIGILIANLINYGTYKMARNGWRMYLGVAAVPAAVMVIGSFVLPDTPNSMLERVEHPWKNLFLQAKYRPALAFCSAIPFFQQFTGINMIMFYAPVLFKTLGFSDDASLTSAVITGVVNVVSTLVSIYAVDRYGRRILFLEGCIQMIISRSGTLTPATADWILAFICIYVKGFAWSWGPLRWLFFLTMLCHMKFGLFYFFGGMVLIMTVFIYFLLPETKGVPIEEMGRVWKQHPFWKRYIPDDAVIGGSEETYVKEG
ncbi:hypothetical protein Bca101_043641 [Brassica carinata]